MASLLETFLAKYVSAIDIEVRFAKGPYGKEVYDGVSIKHLPLMLTVYSKFGEDGLRAFLVELSSVYIAEDFLNENFKEACIEEDFINETFKEAQKFLYPYIQKIKEERGL